MTEKKKIIMTREVIITLPDLRKSGLTNEEIARNLGVSKWTIGFWFKRLRVAGYKIPKPINRAGNKKIQL